MDDIVEGNQSELFDVSIDQQHQHLCSIIGDISQDHSLTPADYFSAACIRLDKLLSSDSSPAADDINDLITFISMHISSAALRNESEHVIVSALNRVSYLLTVATPVTSCSRLFGILLGSIADSRHQVRRQAHACLRDVMQSFQKTPLLSPASEAITSTFESFLQLKEGSSAQDVLYVLDFLKDCLSLMSIKFSTKILIYFKSLLALHQSAVTKKITTALYHLCLQPTIDVSPEVLVDLLCSLATSVSSNDMSGGDNLTFTARLLDIGMKKVFSLNRQTCVVKLPVVFSALTDILASEHEEPLLVASEALKSLIHTCIDESLINYGDIDQITSSGTIIEKLCATVESLLDYRFAAVWDISFQVIAAMFDKLGDFSSYFLKGTLKSLKDIQKLPNEDFVYRKQLHDCVGVAVAALGPETFLKLLPLNLEAQDPNEVNVWLFPILKQNIVGAHLSFFNEYIVDSIRLLKLRSAKHKQEGNIHSARTVDGLVYSLWSLLPSFCNYPVDTAESFKDLKPELCDSLFKESDFRGLICSSLQILIQQNKRIMEVENEASGKVNISQQQAAFLYTSEVASRNLDVLRSYACEMLDTLSKIYMKSSKDDAGSLQMTIREFAFIAEKGVVSRLFKKTMEQLLKVMQNPEGSNSMEIDNSLNETSLSFMRAKLYDLAITLLPLLDTKEIDLLYLAAEFALKLQVEKKAYKVLSTILEHDDSFLARRFEELVKLMHSYHSSVTQHRIDCLYFLIAHVLKDKSEQMELEIFASFLTEIVLALKESNKKTRNRAHEVIVLIGHSCMENGNKQKLYNFFNMVVGGLAGETPHMISASLKCIACLTYEFNVLQSYAFNVLPSTFLLLQRNNRELNKASLGFLKVLVAKSHAEGLQAHLRGMVEALLSWQSSSSKNQLTAKVKQLLEMWV